VAQDIERRLKELSAVNRVGAAVGSELDVDSLCVLAGECLLDIFDTGIVLVALFDAEAGLIETPFFAINGVKRHYEPIAFGLGLSSEVIRTRKPLYIPDEASLHPYAPILVVRTERPPRSWLGVPMMAGIEVMGVVSVQSMDQENAFDEDDIRLLSTLAGTLGNRVQAARLFETVRRRAEEAAAIAEAGRWISESLDLDTVLGRIMDRAVALLTKDSCAVMLREGDYLRTVAAAGGMSEPLNAFPVPAGRGIVGRVVRTGKPAVVNDVLVDPDALKIPGTPPEESREKLLAAPLFAGGEVIGVMAIWREPTEPAFSSNDLSFTMSLARQAEVAIQNARLHLGVKEAAARSAEMYEVARRARAEAEEANRLKSRFLASMSHELRTPLNSIINFAWLLLEGSEGALAPGQADFVSRIHESGLSLLGLINDILDLSKIESGRMELRFEEVALEGVARGVLSTTQGLLRDSPVKLSLDIPADLPPVRADAARLRQVLLNLLSNAAKFTRSGSIILRARRARAVDQAATTAPIPATAAIPAAPASPAAPAGAATQGTARELRAAAVPDPEGDLLLVEVEDTGIGMASEDIPRAFAEFVQLDGELSRSAGGTGLGLSLARNLVELHGGSIWASSERGKGSTFSFCIPFAGPKGGR
jgi:signal transduction histidine kinase